MIFQLVCHSARYLVLKREIGGWGLQWKAFPKIRAVEKSMLLQADLKWNAGFILINKSR